MIFDNQKRLSLGLVLFHVALYFGDIPYWIPGISAVLVFWRFLGDLLPQLPVIQKWGAVFFGLFLGFGVWLEFGTLFGDPASTSLLVIMVSLKVFELKDYRDLMILTYLNLLLLMGKLLNTQSLLMTIVMGLDIGVIFGLMLSYHSPIRGGLFSMRQMIKVFMLSLPVVVAMFFLFPRFQLNLFGQKITEQSSIGFSGQLRPGGVGRLAQQKKQIVFRAFFKDGYLPPVRQLYWRGVTLEEGQGLVWDPDPELKEMSLSDWSQSQDLEKQSKDWVEASEVEIIPQEPMASWLILLDWTVDLKGKLLQKAGALEFLEDRSVRLKSPLTDQQAYRFQYFLNSRLGRKDRDFKQSLKKNMRLKTLSGRLERWFQELNLKARDPDAVISSLQNYFRKNQFRYSLSGPSSEDLEEFLFNTKSGYCEHYAGATATVLRRFGVPARVVVGYQGGERSLFSDYILVSNRDAHAWVEYLNEKSQTWIRIDPTDWIEKDPNLILAYSGLDETASGVGSGWGILTWLDQTQLVVDQFETWWLQTLLKYDSEQQKLWLEKLGIHRFHRGYLILLLSLVLVLLLGLLTMVLKLKKTQRVRLPVRTYFYLISKLQDSGVSSKMSLRAMPPEKLVNLAQTVWPERHQDLEDFLQLFLVSMYGPEIKSQDAGFSRFMRLFKGLSLPSDSKSA